MRLYLNKAGKKIKPESLKKKSAIYVFSAILKNKCILCWNAFIYFGRIFKNSVSQSSELKPSLQRTFYFCNIEHLQAVVDADGNKNRGLLCLLFVN